ncbi:MAG: hypothetical protein HY650_04910 [Acidobacteria bacterium]|nr:hypothetical protein [Acidobacteriota bacterium]
MSQEEITYDELMIAGCGDKRTLFEELSPEKRSDLLRTHIQRFIDNNRTKLGEEQLDVIIEGLAQVKPDVYVRPRTGAELTAFREFDRRAKASFSDEERRDIFTLEGRYQPPALAKPEWRLPIVGGK